MELRCGVAWRIYVAIVSFSGEWITNEADQFQWQHTIVVVGVCSTI